MEYYFKWLHKLYNPMMIRYMHAKLLLNILYNV